MFTGAFAGIERLLIDGNNLLHRVSGGVDPGALRGLLPRLSAAIPATISVIVMLDGHAAPGSGRVHRVRPGLEIRQSGSLSADEALLNLVRERSGWTTLVSDDRALRDKARSLGASTERLDWLESVMAGVVSRSDSGLGNRKSGTPPRKRR